MRKYGYFLWMPVLLVLLLVAAVLVAQDALAPDGVPHEIYVAPFPVAITLDGDLSDWDGVPRVTVPDRYAPGPGVHVVTFAAAADDEYFYFMAEVLDDNVISGQHEENYWNEDSVEFYINATGDLKVNAYVDGIAQITIPPINATLPLEERIVSGVRGTLVGAVPVVVLTETGYIVEVSVPLVNDVWEIVPEHGGALGFQVHLNGATTDARDIKLIWSRFDESDQSYQNPSVFGQLIFSEIGATTPLALPTPIPTPTPMPTVEPEALYRDPNAPIEARIEDLLARMSLEEKIGQMTLIEKGSIVAFQGDIATYALGGLLSGGGGSPDMNTPEAWVAMVSGFQDHALQTRLGIPLIYGVDSVHGHNNLYGAVIFPHNIGLGAANNPDLMFEIGRVTAIETAATGIFWNYAPTIAVAQDPRWGRFYESYSQDTDIVTALGTAYLLGLQGDDLTALDTVIGTPKHYIGDGATAWGSSRTPPYFIDQGDMRVDEATLREMYLPPYIDAIENGARSIMISFSSWNGGKMHGQQYLISGVLKGELGFDGFVVSDWAGIDQVVPGDYYISVVAAINAGIDMNMVPYNYRLFIEAMKLAIANGDISLERVDDAVRRILRVKFEMGLFENPYPDPALLETIGSDEHRAVARQAVSESLVLLKNDNDALPISPDTQTIFVAGWMADNIGAMCGGWTISWQGAAGDITPGTTLYESILHTAPESATVHYDFNANFDSVVDSAGNPIIADVGIVIVGERPYAEGAGDKGDLALARPDVALINKTRERVNTLIVILVSGRPMIITEPIEVTDAFVAAWLPGTEGQGIADALFGYTAFGGRLPFQWPASMNEVPFNVEHDVPPLFPLGYGLETEANGLPLP